MLKLELRDSERQSDQEDQGILLSSLPQYYDWKLVLLPIQIVCGIELMSSCLQGMRFTKGVISPALLIPSSLTSS